MNTKRILDIVLTIVLTATSTLILVNLLTQPITVYTGNDILYIYPNRVTSETGDIMMSFTSQGKRNTFIEETTADHSQIQNWEIVSIATDYSTVEVYPESGEVELILHNPNSDFQWKVPYNRIDTTSSRFTYYLEN